ncbi:MAG: adenine-specific methyltransferase EcoRI family protein [Clostridium sp.]|nr:adenine-specific methyltransferase EcoRI family protein [Clostridium sp.]
MANNANLHAAGVAKKDEFYTQYEDIQSELNHYEKHFKGKTVLCNCDDPFESNFCKFFLRNFNYLGLKRLICTSYSTSSVAWRQMTIWDYLGEQVTTKNGHGYVMDIKEVPMANGRGVSDEDIDKLLKSKKRGVKKLNGDGDFRSDECIEYLKQADIVVTNPPFSLFREYVALLMKYEKKFLIIGNVNAITYKEIFPLIQNDELWLGVSIHSGDRKFYVPDNYPLRAAGCGVDENGRKYIRVKGVRWFTNLDHGKRHEKLILYRKYYGNEEDYPHYANYDAINIDKVADIPCDYFEEMGVPITYLDKHNPEQFEIIGASRWLGRPMSEIAPKGSYVAGGVRFYLPLDKAEETNNNLRAEQSRAEQSRAEQSRAALPLPIRQSCHQTSQSIDDSMTESLLGVRCNGIMGVPITFLDKYNPEQFEILGITLGTTVDYEMTVLFENAVQHNKNGTLQGGSKVNTRAALCVKDKPTGTVYYTADNVDGYLLSIYPRILIKRRNGNEN